MGMCVGSRMYLCICIAHPCCLPVLWMLDDTRAFSAMTMPEMKKIICWGMGRSYVVVGAKGVDICMHTYMHI